jgi:hypothetical protein
LLANAFLQLPVAYLTHRIRQQAGSYSLVSRRIIYTGVNSNVGLALAGKASVVTPKSSE